MGSLHIGKALNFETNLLGASGDAQASRETLEEAKHVEAVLGLTIFQGQDLPIPRSGTIRILAVRPCRRA